MKYFNALTFLVCVFIFSSCTHSRLNAPIQLSDSSGDAILKLRQGNSRFVAGQSIHPNQTVTTLKEVAPKQHPFAIVLSCSDSRVPPEIVFDTGIGDLFVVRTAGEVVDSAALASIEYAIENLGANTLIVMGHDSCGAVKAAMETPIGQSAGSPSLDALIAAIRPNVKDFKVGDPADPTLQRPSSAEVDGVVKQLVDSSRIIQESVKAKKLYFAGALYNLETGSTTFWDEGFPEVSHALLTPVAKTEQSIAR